MVPYMYMIKESWSPSHQTYKPPKLVEIILPEIGPTQGNMVHGTRHDKDNLSQRLNHTCKNPRWKCKPNTSEFHERKGQSNIL